MQAWIMLAGAGLLEIVWAIGLKYADGFTKPVPSAITIVAMAISMYLLAMAARERGLEQDPEVQRTLRQALINRFLEREIDAELAPPPPADVDRYLKEHPDELSRPEEVRVALIAIEDPAKAQRVAALARQSNDLETFRKLVEEHSEDQRGERLEQAQGDLEDEVAHPVRPPVGPGGRG